MGSATETAYRTSTGVEPTGLDADPVVNHSGQGLGLVGAQRSDPSRHASFRRRRAAAVAGLLAAALATSDQGAAQVRFTDATPSSGLEAFDGLQGSVAKDHIIEVMGGGAAFLDFDDDGALDILLVRGSTIEAFRQGGDLMCSLFRGDGAGHFEDVTVRAGLTSRGWGQGVAVGDYNGDGRIDLFLTGYGGNVLYRNLGDGNFEDASRSAGIAPSQWSLGAAFTDFDRDGDLDLYVTNYLGYPLDRTVKRDSNCNYRGFAVFCGPRGLPGLRDSLYLNDGAGRFRDVAAELGIDDERLYGLGVQIEDYDNDSWPDIFVANDLTANLFYRNRGDGSFEELAVLLGAAFSQDGIEEGSMGIDTADFNHDGWLDIYYTNSSYESNSLLVNNGDGSFTNLTDPAGHGQSTHLFVGWGVAAGDLDHDSWEDLLVVNGHLYPEADRFEMGLRYEQRWLVFMNDSGEGFSEKGTEFGLDKRYKSRGLALGDYDNDGDLDAVVNNLDGPPTLLRNDQETGNHWLSVDLRGKRSGRPAVGARVTVRAGGQTLVRGLRSSASYLSANETRLHFGLGEADRVDSVLVQWPSGASTELREVVVDSFLVVNEPAPTDPAD